MKKLRVLLCVVMAAGLALLAGCGSSGEAVDADAKTIGSDLLQKITYADEMTEMDLDTALMIINLSDVNITDSAIYESTGATAEEIVVLKCASSDDAKKASEAFKTRVSEQKESYQDYVPEELTKLNAAVIATSGNFAVLSVSDDPDTAKSIISEYLK